jgi:hypothetical protein
MDGQPVWLASFSRWRGDLAIAVPRWSQDHLRDGEAELRSMLDGVGDPSRERLFRMNVTLCLHRAATDEEVSRMPSWFHTYPACALAGGPVKVLWENVPGSLSTKPCTKPTKRKLDKRDPLLWLPMDCGRCPPCVARSSHCGAVA